MAKKRHSMFSTLQAFKKHEPFTAFQVRLSSGDSIVVTSPADVAMSDKSDAVVLFDGQGDLHITNVRQITTVKPVNGKQRPGPSNN